MALPNSNISTTLVGDTIGSGSRDVGTLCTHPNINKWSKWKPVRFNSVVGLTEAQLQSANYGLKVDYYTYEGAMTAPGTFLYDLKNGNTDWVYLRPRGGSVSPVECYRMGDFRTYNHEAMPPIDAPSSLSVFLAAPNNWFRLSIDQVISPGNTTNVALEDFVINGVPLGDCYLGVLMFLQNNTYIAATAENSLSQGDYFITFTNMQGAIGYWQVAYFLLSYPKGQNDPWLPGTYVPIDLPHTTLRIRPQGSEYEVIPIGYWGTAYTTVQYTLQLVNNTDEAATIDNVRCSLIYTTGSQQPSEGTVIHTENEGPQNIPANSIVDMSGLMFTHTRVDDGREYWLGATYDGGIVTYNLIEDPMGF